MLRPNTSCQSVTTKYILINVLSCTCVQPRLPGGQGEICGLESRNRPAQSERIDLRLRERDLRRDRRDGALRRRNGLPPAASARRRGAAAAGGQSAR
eukprot:4715-Chlamydomonas_euryale.AAC.1